MYKENELLNRMAKKSSKKSYEKPSKNSSLRIACIYCGSKRGSRVVSLYASVKNRSSRRQRICKSCGRKFVTDEAYPD